MQCLTCPDVAMLLVRQEMIGTLSLQNYPDSPDKVAGFVDYHLIQLLQWDHIYTANYFLALLALLGASLAACTSTRQWPMVRVARRYCANSRSFVLVSCGMPEHILLARLQECSMQCDTCDI